MDLDIPRGMSHPWIFVQKRDIFEQKFLVRDSMKEYLRIHRKNQVNFSKLFECISQISELYVQIKEVARKNKDVLNQYGDTIKFFDDLILNITQDIDDGIFPTLYKHYVALNDILYKIGLTDFEKRVQHPGRAVVPEEE